VAFVTPSHQQPLGAKMSLERRFALLQAAEQAQAWIIETIGTASSASPGGRCRRSRASMPPAG